jgi:DNA excision repair protein ERCC-6
VVLIVSYESLKILQKLLLSIRWVAVTLDEGQKIKNPDTSITLLCKDLATYHRLILSGTPIQNNLKELWSLFDFVFPGRLGTLATFETEFATPIKLGGYQNATKLQIEIAIKSATILQQMIQPFLLRRKKDQINHLIHLPKKTEQVLFCTLSPTQRAIYQEIIHSEELQAAIRYKKPLFAAIMTLRKLCNHPMLAYQVGQIQWHDSKNEDREEEAIRLLSTSASSTQWKNGGTSNSNSRSRSSTSLDKNSLHWKDSGKLLVLSHILPLWKQENHKILIFCQMYSMISLLEIMLNELSLPFMRLDGRTPVSKRQQIINYFNSEQPQGEVDEEEEDGDDNNGDGNGNGNDRRRRRRNSPRISILLLTTRTGGVGISLTGANRVILVDPDWNPQIDIQARERAWRIGQKRDVIIYRLITRGTIEEKIYHRQIFKLLLTNRILENPKQKRFFSKHDIEELFELENFGTSNSLPADPDLEISFDEQPAERREEKQGTGADSRGEGGEVRGGAGRDLEEGEVSERMEISSEMISTIDSTIATVLQLEQQLAMSSSSTPSSASSTSAAGSLSSSTSPPPPPSDPDLYPSVHEQEDRDHQLLRALYNGEAIAAVYDHSYFEGNGGGKRIAKNTAAAIAHEKQIKQLAQQVVDEAVKQLRNSNPSIVSSSSRDRLGFIEERSTPRGHGNGGRGRGGRFSSNSQRSSSSMLSGLRQLQGRSPSQEDGSGSGNGSSDLRNVSEGQMTSTVLARLENIFRQRASTETGSGAGAEDRSGLTTDEILAHFSDLPDQFAPIFREMLRRVAVFSEGRWKANAATTLN